MSITSKFGTVAVHNCNFEKEESSDYIISAPIIDLCDVVFRECNTISQQHCVYTTNSIYSINTIYSRSGCVGSAYSGVSTLSVHSMIATYSKSPCCIDFSSGDVDLSHVNCSNNDTPNICSIRNGAASITTRFVTIARNKGETCLKPEADYSCLSMNSRHLYVENICTVCLFYTYRASVNCDWFYLILNNPTTNA